MVLFKKVAALSKYGILSQIYPTFIVLLTGSMIIFVQECTIFEGTNYDSTVIFILPGAMQYNVSIQKSFSKISSISQGYSVQKNCVSVYVTMYSYGR